MKKAIKPSFFPYLHIFLIRYGGNNVTTFLYTHISATHDHELIVIEMFWTQQRCTYDFKTISPKICRYFGYLIGTLAIYYDYCNRSLTGQCKLKLYKPIINQQREIIQEALILISKQALFIDCSLVLCTWKLYFLFYLCCIHINWLPWTHNFTQTAVSCDF